MNFEPGHFPNILLTNSCIPPCERPPTTLSIEYDLSGNRIRDSRWSYAYDGENRLIRMTNLPAYSSTQTELRFVYDAEHRRVQKIILESGIPVDVTAFLYDDFKVIAKLDSSGNPKQTFHWTHEGPGGLLALTDHRTSPRQTHVAGYDGRGNLTTLLNAADASLSAAYEYSPFGEVIRATGPYAPQNPVGFSTIWTDRTTHLNYYGYLNKELEDARAEQLGDLATLCQSVRGRA